MHLWRLSSSKFDNYRYPIPYIHGTAATNQSKGVFSSLDLIMVYHQIPIEHEYVSNTAITVPFVMFQSLCVHFGFTKISHVLSGIIDYAMHNLNFCCTSTSVVVKSFRKSIEEHMKHVRLQIFHVPRNHVKSHLQLERIWRGCWFVKKKLWLTETYKKNLISKKLSSRKFRYNIPGGLFGSMSIKTFSGGSHFIHFDISQPLTWSLSFMYFRRDIWHLDYLLSFALDIQFIKWIDNRPA